MRTSTCWADGRRLILLAEGRVVNLVAAEGQPGLPSWIPRSAIQALALAGLNRRRAEQGRNGGEPGPAEIDDAGGHGDAGVARTR